jgi:hypothetical protein
MCRYCITKKIQLFEPKWINTEYDVQVERLISNTNRNSSSSMRMKERIKATGGL